MGVEGIASERKGGRGRAGIEKVNEAEGGKRAGGRGGGRKKCV